MEVSSQSNAPAALPDGKETPLSTEKETGWAVAPSWTFWRIDLSRGPGGLWTLDRPARVY